MRGFRLIVLVLACAGLICAWAPAGALASSGCNGSAGDSQYVDPLANCNPPATGSGGGGGSSGASSSQTSSGTATTPSQTATIASSTTTTTHTASASKDPSSSKTLPFTGLDLVPALLVASALLGSGLALRRLTGDAG